MEEFDLGMFKCVVHKPSFFFRPRGLVGLSIYLLSWRKQFGKLIRDVTFQIVVHNDRGVINGDSPQVKTLDQKALWLPRYDFLTAVGSHFS
jgi:hypothetical protein